MHISEVFIRRPVATTLLLFSLLLSGCISFFFLPVAPLPQMDFPTIRVMATFPGASPEVMAATVATPLENALGRIAGVEEITSQSTLGTSSITVQFSLDRNIDGAVQDVQAAISAAQALLPPLPTRPSYRKVNPADAPILILVLHSTEEKLGKLYDLASSVLAQKISQLEGVGQVQVSGSSLPAVRVDVDPLLLAQSNLSLDEVRNNISRANTNIPKGFLSTDTQQFVLDADDSLQKAEEFGKIIVQHKDGASLRLDQIATVRDAEQDKHIVGLYKGKPSVIIIVYKQPGANIVATVNNIKKELPRLSSWVSGQAELNILIDRSTSIGASLLDVELSLLLAVLFVVLVIFLFLREGKAALIPALAIPVSLSATLAMMYFSNFSLNHLSLMALTIATGFVVDDAIVVTENIVRYIEKGENSLNAALLGSREVAFTVFSISLSLIAIFVPLLGIGGLVGKLFYEFALTLSWAIIISLLISLSAIPMLCAYVLKIGKTKKDKKRKAETVEHSVFHRVATFFQRKVDSWFSFLDFIHELYAKSLSWVLRHKKSTLFILFVTVVLNIYLYIVVPKGFVPSQDTGQALGIIRADQTIAFESMLPKFQDFMDIVDKDPAVEGVGGFMGGMQSNTGIMFINLKPRSIRKLHVDNIIGRLRKEIAKVPGAQLFIFPLQDIRAGGREGRGSYQYSLRSDDLTALRTWSVKALEALSDVEGVVDANSSQENKGLELFVSMDRDSLGRYQVDPFLLDTTLGFSFGQRFASTIYTDSNQYRVVLGFSPDFQKNPEALDNVYIKKNSSALEGGGESSRAYFEQIPLAALSSAKEKRSPLSVSHQDQMADTALFFSLLPEYQFSVVQENIEKTMEKLSLPTNVIGSFQGTVKAFKPNSNQELYILVFALLTLYIVLGILYESYIHPLTVLSTLPSAGLGALLGLLLLDEPFTLIAFLGVLLLGGIVKKNAIMMIDFAISARRRGLDAEKAIYEACLLRFRPILMTTVAAIFGALPLLFNFGEGAELRSPLGITIVGGLLVSQILTLYTTPVVYLYLDKYCKYKAIKEVE